MCNAASICWNSIYKIFLLSLQAAGWSDITQLTYSSHQGPAMHVHAGWRQNLVLITNPTHFWECFTNLLLHFKNKIFFQSNGNSTPKPQASNFSMQRPGPAWTCRARIASTAMLPQRGSAEPLAANTPTDVLLKGSGQSYMKTVLVCPSENWVPLK